MYESALYHIDASGISEMRTVTIPRGNIIHHLDQLMGKLKIIFPGVNDDDQIKRIIMGDDYDKLSTFKEHVQSDTVRELVGFGFSHLLFGGIGHLIGAKLNWNEGAGTVGPIHDTFVNIGEYLKTKFSNPVDTGLSRISKIINYSGTTISLPSPKKFITDWKNDNFCPEFITTHVTSLEDIYSGQADRWENLPTFDFPIFETESRSYTGEQTSTQNPTSTDTRTFETERK